MSGRYAAGTAVPETQSKAEIERMLARYGCSSFQSGWNQDGSAHFAHIGFRHGDVSVLLGVPMARPEEFLHSPAGRRRTKESAEQAYWAERRRRWRALLLIIQAKLEAVNCGISTLEREFLADVVLPNGRTLGEWAVPHLKEIQSGHLRLPAPAAAAAEESR